MEVKQSYRTLRSLFNSVLPEPSDRVFSVDETIEVPRFNIVGENCGGDPKLANAEVGESGNIHSDNLKNLEILLKIKNSQHAQIENDLSILKADRAELILHNISGLSFNEGCNNCCNNSRKLNYSGNVARARELDGQIMETKTKLVHIYNDRRKLSDQIAEAKRYRDNVHPQHIVDMAKRQLLYNESIREIENNQKGIQLIVDLMFALRCVEQHKRYDAYLKRIEFEQICEEFVAISKDHEELIALQAQIRQNIKNHEEKTARHNELAEELSRLTEKLLKLGDTSQIVDRVKHISEMWNNNLSAVSNLQIEMSYNEKSKLSMNIIEDEQEIAASIASGYQKFILDLTMRETLAQVAQISTPDFLIIDEGFGSADEYNITRIRDYLEYSARKYRFVLIISHITGINVDKKLQIISNPKFSSIHIGNLPPITDKTSELLVRYNVIRMLGDSVVELKDNGKFRCKCCKTNQNTTQQRMKDHMATASHKSALIAHYS
jgi:DNA repair exonuclease SbcCD ATPase subunit